MAGAGREATTARARQQPRARVDLPAYEPFAHAFLPPFAGLSSGSGRAGRPAASREAARLADRLFWIPMRCRSAVNASLYACAPRVCESHETPLTPPKRGETCRTTTPTCCAV